MIDIGNHNIIIHTKHSATRTLDGNHTLVSVEAGHYYMTGCAVDDDGNLIGYIESEGDGLLSFEPEVWRIEDRYSPVDPANEMTLKLGSSKVRVVVESADANIEGTSYVRFVVNDHEVLYWNSDEWEEDGQNVMGAIFGAINSVVHENEGIEL
jgi:hypothetical protein